MLRQFGIAGVMIGPTQKTAMELYQIFDMPRHPFALERKIGQGTFGTVLRKGTRPPALEA